MMNPWALSALSAGLMLVAALFANWARFLSLLPVLIMGAVAQIACGVAPGIADLRGNVRWIALLACTAIIALIFLVCTELDLIISKAKSRAALAVGRAEFFGTIRTLPLESEDHSKARYSFSIGKAIAPAVIPVVAANAFFLSRHLPPRAKSSEELAVASAVFDVSFVGAQLSSLSSQRSALWPGKRNYYV